jgi:predicted MFS family arabinose efflux permease
MSNRGIELIVQTWRVTLKLNQLIVVTSALATANVAVAGPTVPLGISLGVSLGTVLGQVLGNPLGAALPIASGGLLTVAALSLVLGIHIVRRKRNH